MGIRGIQSEVLPHPRRDPAVFRESHNFLRPWLGRADFALVAFDRHGCGSTEPREALEAAVERRLLQNGWGDHCAVVVPDPELEAWLWGEYSEVAALLGWSPSSATLRDWLTGQGLLQAGQRKPDDPKVALERTLYALRKRRESALYFDLGSRMSFERCTDPAFLKLKSKLQSWFPPETKGSR